MSALAAVTEPFSTRARVPVPGGSLVSTVAHHKFLVWAMKAFLTGELTGGTTGPTSRAAGSLWSVLRSSDGVSVSTSDLWGATYDESKIVLAATGTAHSWIVLSNGVHQIVIDANSPTAGAIGLSAVRSSVGFATGTTATRPVSAGGSSSEEFMLGTNATTAATTSTGVFVDLGVAASTYVSFATNATGDRWWFAGHRDALVQTWIAFWRGTGSSSADEAALRNQWWLKGSLVNGRGGPAYTTLTGSGGAQRRGFANTAPVATSGLRSPTIGGSTLTGTGADPDTGRITALPCDVARPPYWSGTLPDLTWVAGGTLGASVPSVAAAEFAIAGDLAFPCEVPILSASSSLSRDAFELVGGVSSGPAPVVALVSPAAGSDIQPDTQIVIDVTDDLAVRRAIITARFASLALEEVVHTGDRFGPRYVGTVAAIAGGSRLTLQRVGGWPAAPTLDVYALDTTGGEA